MGSTPTMPTLRLRSGQADKLVISCVILVRLVVSLSNPLPPCPQVGIKVEYLLMYTLFQIHRADIYDPNHILVEGELVRGEIELDQRLFLKHKKFVIDSILAGEDRIKHKIIKPGRCVFVLRASTTKDITPELIRFIQGQSVQVL